MDNYVLQREHFNGGMLHSRVFVRTGKTHWLEVDKMSMMNVVIGGRGLCSLYGRINHEMICMCQVFEVVVEDSNSLF